MMDNLNIYEVQVLGGILDNALKDRASFVRVELDGVFDHLDAGVLRSAISTYLESQNMEAKEINIMGKEKSAINGSSINLLKNHETGAQCVVIKFPMDMSTTPKRSPDLTPGQIYLAQNNIL